ncbi:unnamed protein product, partial [Effrenium voratum]
MRLSKQLHKFEKESKELGKASFFYAWVLDEGDDERSRGVTIDVCVKHFRTKSRQFTILDAPGHRDFVPNMVHGAVQADVAILVVDVSHFEAGFDRGGQTKEHLQLIRALGIANVVVAVNKLDTCAWDQKVFEETKRRVQDYMLGPEVGYKESSVQFVPLSGFSGENMLERKDAKLSWWTGGTLLEALDQLPAPPRPPSTSPLRLCVSDVYRSGANTCVSGKVLAGTLNVGQKVLLQPSNEQTTVKGLMLRDAPTRSARAGDHLDTVTLPVEPQFASVGGVLSDPRSAVPLSDTLQVQILVFETEVPLMRGAQLMCYLHTETLTATLVRLEKLIVKGEPQERRPKCLVKGNNAIVWLQLNEKVCVEPKPKPPGVATPLSRFVLRDRGRTVPWHAAFVEQHFANGDITAMAADFLSKHQSSRAADSAPYVDAMGNPLPPIRKLDDLPNIKDPAKPVEDEGPISGTSALVQVEDVRPVAREEPADRREAPVVTHERAQTSSRTSERQGSTASSGKLGEAGESKSSKLRERPERERPERPERESPDRKGSRRRPSEEAAPSAHLPPEVAEELQAELDECLDTIKWCGSSVTRDSLQDVKNTSRPAPVVKEVLE